MIIVGLLLIVANTLYSIFRYANALLNVEQYAVSTNLLYIIIFGFMPLLWWAYSTKSEDFIYWDIKKRLLRLSILCSALTLVNPVWTLIFDTLVIRICRLPVGRNLDSMMILNLCRLSLFAASGLIVYIICALAFDYIKREEINEKIKFFRWQQLVDTRKNKEWLFDLRIIRKMKTGALVKIKEIDRRVHIFILGTSGTGKTSSAMIPAIVDDLNQKVKNRKKRESLISMMIKNGKARVTRPQRGKEIDESCVKAEPGYEKELADIKATYGDCGITVMAPNNTMNKKIINLAKARNLKVNVIDPAEIYDDKNVKNVSINPFFLPPGLDSIERQIVIGSKSKMFADVINAVYDLAGTSDVYFTGINKSVTTNIAIMCMLHAALNGTQTDIVEVQRCINEFTKLRPIVEDIQHKLHMKVIVEETDSNNKNKNSDNGMLDRDSFRKADMSPTGSEFIFYEITEESEIPEELRRQGVNLPAYNRMLKEEAESYYEAIHFVLIELLGTGKEKMFDQARGLRNLFNNLLIDPRIKRVLSGREGDILDWDTALAKNEITIINTALEYGQEGSTGLGLLLMMLMKIATLRRPEDTRSNHFLYIDEASQYMHPVYEDMFALYRQYNVCCTIMMQSLSQMYKSNATKYLKDVITGAGIHIVFGRITPEEQKFYEEMGGKIHKSTKQTSISQNSEFDDKHSISRSTRIQKELQNNTEGYQLRIRNFQEVTVFMVDEGNVKNSFIGKTYFPSKKEFEDHHIEYEDYSKYATFSLEPKEEPKKYSQSELKATFELEEAMLAAKSKRVKKEVPIKMADLKILDDDDAMAEIEEERKRIKELYAKRQTANKKRKSEVKEDISKKKESKKSAPYVKQKYVETEEDFFKTAQAEFEKNFEKKEKKQPQKGTAQAVRKQKSSNAVRKVRPQEEIHKTKEELSEEELIQLVRNQMGKGRYAGRKKANA